MVHRFTAFSGTFWRWINAPRKLNFEKAFCASFPMDMSCWVVFVTVQLLLRCISWKSHNTMWLIHDVRCHCPAHQLGACDKLLCFISTHTHTHRALAFNPQAGAGIAPKKVEGTLITYELTQKLKYFCNIMILNWKTFSTLFQLETWSSPPHTPCFKILKNLLSNTFSLVFFFTSSGNSLSFL